ncbi:MAG TPA: multicopper oxidase domain-containing protein [Pseudogracilibacillus sp.]|nr:multicopper oxidase domain-containing protein [Pseudogracilibacillus sp.]
MRKMILILTLMTALIISGCGLITPASSDKQMPNNKMHSSNEENDPSNKTMGMMGGHGHDMPLDSSTGENELNIPPILASDSETESNIYYTIDAQQGQTEIFDGIQTKTLGYNSAFLGPVVKLKKGQTANITLKNSLDEETTFHWHGLIIDGEADGGPHAVIEPGEEKEITFDVQQDRATLWFHPHPEGKTAKQVFGGLAGLLYIEDDLKDTYEYGENDFPLIIQDRTFDDEKQLNYDAVKDPDGTMGETLLINGTVNPRLTVKQEKVRLRLLNGSNMRNYTIKLSNNEGFEQIASDGGLLNEPVKMDEIQLTPSERAEIVVDFSKFDAKDEVELMMDDETVLLPFEINDKVKVSENELEEIEDPVTISEEIRNKPVSKKIKLSGMGHHVAINDQQFDKNRIDMAQALGETEVWEIYNEKDMMGGMIHPFHIHGTQFKVISINKEEPPENLQGYKDTLSIEPGDKAKIAVKFTEPGIYMYHCHILEHEDNGMMGQIEVE